MGGLVWAVGDYDAAADSRDGDSPVARHAPFRRRARLLADASRSSAGIEPLVQQSLSHFVGPHVTLIHSQKGFSNSLAQVSAQQSESRVGVASFGRRVEGRLHQQGQGHKPRDSRDSHIQHWRHAFGHRLGLDLQTKHSSQGVATSGVDEESEVLEQQQQLHFRQRRQRRKRRHRRQRRQRRLRGQHQQAEFPQRQSWQKVPFLQGSHVHSGYHQHTVTSPRNWNRALVEQTWSGALLRMLRRTHRNRTLEIDVILLPLNDTILMRVIIAKWCHFFWNG